MAEKTFLHDCHVALGGRMVEFAGWMLPVQYEGVLTEHAHCRQAAALFDTSHMGQFLLSGPGAGAALGRACTQDAREMPVGRCRYGFLLNERGGVLDDTILVRLGPESFLLVVNAATRNGDANVLRERLGTEAELQDRTADGWAKIDLQGPQSCAVLGPRTDGDLSELGYFRARTARCAGRNCVISRTGYTGELGYEIMAPAGDLAVIADALLAEDAVKPAGLGARDSLRLEMGYPLYGHELDAEHTPIEAGLERFIDLGRDFVGADALRRQAKDGPTRRLAALRADTRRRANPGDAILADGNEIGVVTSGGFSPSLGRSIAMGYLDPEWARAGRELTVRTPRAEVSVEVRLRPLYEQGTCRLDPARLPGS